MGFMPLADGVPKVQKAVLVHAHTDDGCLPVAYADILLVDGDPTQDIKIMTQPEKNFRIIMKDGKFCKNSL